MKYPDINIQIEYPNKLINADTPLEVGLIRFSIIMVVFSFDKNKAG